MMKKKIKDITLGEIIELGDKYRGVCEKCPLFDFFRIPCTDYCEVNEISQCLFKEDLEQEVEME